MWNSSRRWPHTGNGSPRMDCRTRARSWSSKIIGRRFSGWLKRRSLRPGSSTWASPRRQPGDSPPKIHLGHEAREGGRTRGGAEGIEARGGADRGTRLGRAAQGWKAPRSFDDASEGRENMDVLVEEVSKVWGRQHGTGTGVI